MSKYCPKCKQNFSDSFEECVYCNTPLVNGLIEMDDVYYIRTTHNVRFRNIRKVQRLQKKHRKPNWSWIIRCRVPKWIKRGSS